MLNKIPNDVLELFVSYLNMYDTMQLSLVNKETKRDTKNFIIKKLSLSFKSQTGDFMENILKLNCYLSGSYLMHTIMGNYKLAGDIDIYINIKDSQEVHDFIMSLNTFMYKNKEIPCVVFDNTTQNEFVYKNSHYISSVKKYKILKKYENIYPEIRYSQSIDLVILNNSENIEEYIKYNFDLSCSKNWFNGKSLYINKTVDTFGPIRKAFILEENYKRCYSKGRIGKYNFKHNFEIVIKNKTNEEHDYFTKKDALIIH